jgi:NAD(P)-dependent dehydrogenase (short-subunit alcohol dehydrogenase family)
VLLSKGAIVYITGKSAATARSAIDDLKRETQRDTIFFLRLDLTDLDSVKTAADEFMGKEKELHTLYNNESAFCSPVFGIHN